MSGMTLESLLSFDAAPWQDAADRWQQLGQGVDRTTDQLIHGTRDLAHAWADGAGSVAAAEEATLLRAAVDNTYSRVGHVRQVMDHHAYAMSALRQQAENIVASARDAGYSVDTAAMTITAPASAYLGGNLDRTGRETGTLLNDLRAVVEYARAQDDATAASINENVPSGQTGFGTASPAAIARAEGLLRKLKNPAHQPTPAELDELRDLVKLHGRDKVFAHTLLNSLGPRGLLELNGTLATYQLDHPGKGVDDLVFSRDTADMVRDLQNGLGVMLGTATEPSGTRGGLRGEDYVPGEYELSSRWVSDLMAAGRSRMDIGDPSSPARYVEDVYGYQLLGPLLHNGGLDPGFLSTVGGDIVDFEREQGRNSALWNEAGGDNVRLDWTQGHDDNTVPAGYDPVNALMDGLSRNGVATRELLTGVTEFTVGGPEGGRLPRLDYLLTDRNWDATADLPGGPGWAAEAMKMGDEPRNSALDDFGRALELATTEERGPEATRLVESIVLETNTDEEVTRKFDEWHKAQQDGEKDADKEKGFGKIDVIKPEMRDSMAGILSNYIVDVNQNLAPGQPVGSGSFQSDPTHLLRFVADIGKDEGAHATLATAEAGYAAGMHENILSGRQNPADDIRGNLDAMRVVSHNYGNVMGRKPALASSLMCAVRDLWSFQSHAAMSFGRDTRATPFLLSQYDASIRARSRSFWFSPFSTAGRRMARSKLNRSTATLPTWRPGTPGSVISGGASSGGVMVMIEILGCWRTGLPHDRSTGSASTPPSDVMTYLTSTRAVSRVDWGFLNKERTGGTSPSPHLGRSASPKRDVGSP
jgi:hypothetical protein